ncbi:unnamed protein product [Oikopleura dioica]|uniref:EF-hand domain-containing protein n=1 Tax=Oikopleura dioica TaxID=34765 RepID=E4XMY7_OIKDI|nr:unnamed protein product [Oikopleura dioica]CBY33369.1 unnamed protein product [Oikopleura dioica]
MAPKKGKKKAGTSNVFSQFEQSQIQEFKEAFGMIDANRDGFIDKDDLRATYASLGVMSIENSKLDEMMAEAPAAINFTVFLSMLADKLNGADSEDVIVNAFKLFDPEGKGSIPKEYLSEVLTTQADRFNEDELKSMIDAASIDEAGNLDYKGLAYIMTHGDDEEGEEEGEEEEEE